MRLSLGVLLGLLIVLVGVSIVLDVLFHIHIPVIRSAFAVLLIYLGVRVLIGAWAPVSRPASEGSTFMSQRLFNPTIASDRMRYDVVFGESIVDLTGLPERPEPTQVEVNAVFGSAVVKIDPSQAIDIQGSSVFGEARMPDQTLAAFGEIHYRPPGQRDASPRIRVKVNAVFGSVRVQEVSPARADRPSTHLPAESAAH